EKARDHLRNSFDVLMEARERFYPVDSYLLDLTLVAPTTIGASLRRELLQTSPVNLLLAAETLELLAASEPQTLAALRGALERGSAALIGGEYQEAPLPLLSAEAIRAELLRGAAAYQHVLQQQPKVYGRRTAGLVASLPQILARMGYLGAIHATFDEGRLPRCGQSKARWQGWDHTSLDAFARMPLDAREPGTFLGLAARLGETMDLDHVASLAFVHWPDDTSPWYADLRRVHEFVPLFGKFVTVEEYFGQTDTAGGFTKLATDDYQSPYLAQDVRAGRTDPVSRSCTAATRDSAAQADSGVALMQASLGAAPTGSPRELAQTLAAGGDASQLGQMVINPLSFARPALVPGSPRAGETSWQRVEVAALGFAWVGPETAPPPTRAKKAPRPLAAELTLGNEFFEIGIHPETGGIGHVRDFRNRGNRLSQQLAGRLGSSAAGADAEYSTMRAEAIEVTIADPAVGEIVSRGRLLGPAGDTWAKFEQAVRVMRGARMATLTVRLEIDKPPQGDPWQCYYGSRIAWSDESAELYRSVTGTSQPTEARRLEAPLFVEIRDDRQRTAILTGGLPYHRRSGSRMLDTLLVPPGETRREFRLGVGVDLPCVASAALELTAPPPAVVEDVARPRGHLSGWLFRLDLPQAVVTHWEPLWDTSAAPAARRAIGFRARILETSGRPGRGRLESFRAIRGARQVDLLGQPLVELRLVDDGVMLDIGAYEWLEVEAEWRE
ncbi:MAG: hypothetical protein JNG90_20255, partial [Planctomycetaceae bacterium]|nr:hypothetical protein [Planctomycetaceae bacterium]